MVPTGGGRDAAAGEVPEKLQRSVRAVLLSSPNGVLLHKFCREYMYLAKERFPWKTMGYSSAADLLKAMPRVVSWKFSEKDKEYRIYGIANANNYLPSWLRKFDGRAASVPPPSSLPRRQPVTPPSRKPVKPVKMVKPVQSLHKGGSEWKRQLMAVHVRFRFGPGSNDIDTSAATVKMMENKLPEAMKAAGYPKDVYISPSKGFAFVRFSTVSEARRAIQLVSGTYIGKTYVLVTVAQESRDRMSATGREGEVAEGHARECSKSEGGPLQVQWREKESEAVNCTVREGKKEESSSPPTSGSSDSWDEELLASFPITRAGMEPGQPGSVSVPLPDLERNGDLLKLSPQSIPNSNGLIPVHVSLVKSPSVIWVQVTSDPKRDLERLSQYMAVHRPARLTQVVEGGVCCLRLMSGGYCRVQVVEFDNFVARQQGLVLHIDSGGTKMISCSQLHQLPPSLSLSRLRPLALPCRLANISPSFGEDQWFFYDNQLLWKLIMDKKVYVKKIPQSQTSAAACRDTPRVVVEMYLDPSSQSNVSDLLLSSGLHVKPSETNSDEIKYSETNSDELSIDRKGYGYRQEFVDYSYAPNTLLPHSNCEHTSLNEVSPSHTLSPSPPPLVTLTPPTRSQTPPPSVSKSPLLRLQHLLSSLPPKSTS